MCQTASGASGLTAMTARVRSKWDTGSENPGLKQKGLQYFLVAQLGRPLMGGRLGDGQERNCPRLCKFLSTLIDQIFNTILKKKDHILPCLHYNNKTGS